MNNRPFAPFYLANRWFDPDLPDDLSRVEVESVSLDTQVVVFKIFYDDDEICCRADLNFRNLSVSDNAIEVGAGPWFDVGKFEVCPEAFSTILFSERSTRIESGRRLPPEIAELGGSEVRTSRLVETSKQVVVGDRLYLGVVIHRSLKKRIARCFLDIKVRTEPTMVASPIHEVMVV
jgi:hypothetical protein